MLSSLAIAVTGPDDGKLCADLTTFCVERVLG
jgi:hypothetical protein